MPAGPYSAPLEAVMAGLARSGSRPSSLHRSLRHTTHSPEAAYGLWGTQAPDGLAYQEQMPGEW